MTVKVQGLMLPGRQLSTVTVSGTIDEVESSSIAIYSGATVPVYRQLEVYNAWKRAWDGAKDRNIMQQFAGVWYSGYPIDKIDESARITSATFADFGDNDVFIGMGQLVVAEFLDYVNIIDAAYGDIRDAALEQYFKVV